MKHKSNETVKLIIKNPVYVKINLENIKIIQKDKKRRKNNIINIIYIYKHEMIYNNLISYKKYNLKKINIILD